MLGGLVQHFPDAKPGVLWHAKVADLVLVYELFGAVDEVLHVENGVALVGGKEGVAVDGEEEISIEND